MTTRTTLLIISALGLLACRSRDGARQPTPASAATQAKLEHATQADLARELDEAERRGTWREVRTRWQGQHVQWSVTRTRALCRSKEACNVSPFPIQRPARYGWLPGLEFAPGEFARLEAACAAAEHCELEFEGTLSALELSPDLPTSLRFGNVKILRARGV